MAAENDTDVLIIGGGITGLTAAYCIHQANPSRKVTVLEASERSGGNIRTERVDGCLLDAGPDSFVAAKPWALELVKELGLSDQLIYPDPFRSKIYLARDDRLHALPKGMALGIPRRILPFVVNKALPLRVRARMALDLFSPRRFVREDESIATFMTRHFGAKAVSLLIEPILGGIYAGRCDQLSMAATFPQMKELEAKYGSLIRAFRQAPRATGPVFYSLRDGMGKLVETLEARLPKKTVMKGESVTSIETVRSDSGFVAHTAEGARYRAAQIIVATPAPQAATFFSGENMDAIRAQLDRFRSVSTVTVFLAFRRRDLRHPLDGHGFVVPRTENARIMASTWISSKFPNRSPDEIILIRCFLGGAHREEYANLSPEDLLGITRKELRHFLGVTAAPLFHRVYYWPKASAQYAVGHVELCDRLDHAAAAFPGLHFIGSSYRGIGIPDCIRQARETAAKISVTFAQQPGHRVAG